MAASDRGVDGGAGKKRDAKKSKTAARRLPDCARRAQGFLKTIKVLKHKVGTAVENGEGSILCLVGVYHPLARLERILGGNGTLDSVT